MDPFQKCDNDLMAIWASSEQDKKAEEAHHPKDHGSVARALATKSPLEEVREVIRSREKKAEEQIQEHGVRLQLRKLAAEKKNQLLSFLERGQETR